MYKHILVALNGKIESEQAVKQAIALAKVTGAALTGISVIEKLPAYAASVGEVEDAKNEMENFYSMVQAHAKDAAQGAGVKMKTIIRAGNAAQVIIHYAQENRVDLIVVGADGRRGLGGTAGRVAEAAPCSVLVARVSLPSVKVKDVMTKEVTSVTPQTPISEIVELLIEKGLKATPVVENGKVVGIITGGDLLSRADIGLRISLQRTLPPQIFNEMIQKLAEEGKTAKDLMTSPVITIGEDEPVKKAAALMTEKNVKRLPVVNRQNELVGIISRFDILALIVSSGPSTEVFPGVTGSTAKTAGDIMFRDVPTVGPDSPMNEVINKILSTPLRRVVVIDENRHVLGIIVDADLIKERSPEKVGGLLSILSRFTYPSSTTLNLAEKASQVMSKEVYSVSPDTTLPEVIQLMLEKRIKRLVVTDEEKRLVGMVSREIILRVLSSSEAG